MHMILKSDLKMAQTSARCIPFLLLEDDCAHNHASYNIENFSTSLVIQMACAGGPDLQLVK